MRLIFLSFLSSILLAPLPTLAAGGGGGGGGGSPAPAPVVAPIVVVAPVAATPTPAVVVTPAPAPTPATAPIKPAVLQCDQETMKERIRCRLSLSEEDLEAELAVQYLPEECRSLSSVARVSCIERYKALKPCWAKPIGLQRATCARQVLEIGSSANAALRACNLKRNREERANCLANAKDRIYALIKFRLYDLSERAEELLEKGTGTVDAVTDLVNAMESYKQEFNAAKTYGARRAALVKARNTWAKFVRAHRGKITASDYLDTSFSELLLVR